MIETKIIRALIEASLDSNHDSFHTLLKAISEVINPQVCSLWKLNNLSKSVSILARIGCEPSVRKNYEYVHKIEGSLIGWILKNCNGKSYVDIPSVHEKPYSTLHKSPERVRQMSLKRLVSIPIPCYESDSDEIVIDAVLNLYLPDEFNFTNNLANTIRDQFSLSISRTRLLQREELTRKIINIYEEKAQKTLSDVLYPIIHSMLPEYIQYEGCSVFIWDPFYNRLTLSQTTGLKGNPRKNTVYYNLGEGLTGRIAELKNDKIIEELSNITDVEIKIDYKHKYEENTPHTPKTFLAIPIMSPSRPTEVVGVIRITNRLNKLANVVDYFSLDDFDLILHACRMIALYMDYEYSERQRLAFALQIAHEMKTPSFAIKGTADRLINEWNSVITMPDSKKQKFIKDILDHSSIQLALAETIIYWGKGKLGRSDKTNYRIIKCNLGDKVIFPGKKMIIPIARSERLTFDNINISGTFPTLFIDDRAFRQIFFNLFTNAIKYRDKTDPSQFNVSITCSNESSVVKKDSLDESHEALGEGYLIKVCDYGRGINSKEIKKIFLLGYRQIGQEKYDVRGLGVGLTVAKEILEDFYCRIWVSNNKNPTEFSIFIPLKLETISYAYNSEWKK